MSKEQDDTMPTTFPAKWTKLLKENPEFKQTADAASEEDLKKIIYQSEGNIYTIEKAKEEDPTLISKKEELKQITGPYNDALKNQMMKIKYCLFVLEGKGIDLDTSQD
jgi:hypothetical protein